MNQVGRARLGAALVALLFVVAGLLVGCGKDASIQLTRPEVKPSETHKVTFNLESPEKKDFAVKVQPIEVSETLQGSAQRKYDIPKGEPFRLALTLPRGWEIEKWEVSDGATADTDPSKKEIEVKEFTQDIRVSVKVRKIGMLRFQVRVAGTDYFSARAGSGKVQWGVYKPGEAITPFTPGFGVGGYCDSHGEANPMESQCKPHYYENGSGIYIVYTGIGATGIVDDQSIVTELVLEDHTDYYIDFNSLTQRNLKERKLMPQEFFDVIWWKKP